MLGLYIHIPFCVSKCKYCDFNSFKLNLNDKIKYLNALNKEMELYKEEIKGKSIDSIFIGGGTPSILTKEEIAILLKYDVDTSALEAQIESYGLPEEVIRWL